jgi:monothiol glutaredoxin
MDMMKFIRDEIADNQAVLFMKGTPAAPACGFSAQVVQIPDHLGLSYVSHNVYDSDELRSSIKVFSNWPTIPQLYVNGEFVGGCDIVTEMFRSGELKELFASRKTTAEQQA